MWPPGFGSVSGLRNQPIGGCADIFWQRHSYICHSKANHEPGITMTNLNPKQSTPSHRTKVASRGPGQ